MMPASCLPLPSPTPSPRKKPAVVPLGSCVACSGGGRHPNTNPHPTLTPTLRLALPLTLSLTLTLTRTRTPTHLRGVAHARIHYRLHLQIGQRVAVPVRGLGRRSSVSVGPLEGWLMASKRLGPLPRIRWAALGRGCGREGGVGRCRWRGRPSSQPASAYGLASLLGFCMPWLGLGLGLGLALGLGDPSG